MAQPWPTFIPCASLFLICLQLQGGWMLTGLASQRFLFFGEERATKSGAHRQQSQVLAAVTQISVTEPREYGSRALDASTERRERRDHHPSALPRLRGAADAPSGASPDRVLCAPGSQGAHGGVGRPGAVREAVLGPRAAPQVERVRHGAAAAVGLRPGRPRPCARHQEDGDQGSDYVPGDRRLDFQRHSQSQAADRQTAWETKSLAELVLHLATTWLAFHLCQTSLQPSIAHTSPVTDRKATLFCLGTCCKLVLLNKNAMEYGILTEDRHRTPSGSEKSGSRSLSIEQTFSNRAME